MGRPIGSNVGLYWDSPRDLEPGDYLQTPTFRTYLVVTVRIQEKGIHVGRKHIRAIVVDCLDIPDGAKIHPIYWYLRSQRKRS